ncbi:MAG: hypothetical protein N2578_06695 [Bdellovibrionaceae bacterium]|nr:hypothetical protein [Pseudobdellovibrionaceae bacterium]
MRFFVVCITFLFSLHGLANVTMERSQFWLPKFKQDAKDISTFSAINLLKENARSKEFADRGQKFLYGAVASAGVGGVFLLDFLFSQKAQSEKTTGLLLGGGALVLGYWLNSKSQENLSSAVEQFNARGIKRRGEIRFGPVVSHDFAGLATTLQY